MMEEEVSYSTVIFKKDRPPSKKNTEEPTIYSEVKPKPATTEPNGEAAGRSHVHLLPVCLGILGILLMVSIITIIYISVVMNQQKTNLSNLMAQNQMLENKSEELSRDRDDLNWTLGVILKFNNFPVRDFCPDKKCQPCVNGWTLFQNKCYLFYNESAPWKTWKQSRSYCRDRAADLVVIDDLREQEFIGNHTQYYFTKYHGYWIGLKKTGQNWVWVDGRNDTLGYWIQGQYGTEGGYALMIPGRPLTESWHNDYSIFQNKFICEGNVLIRSK